MSAITLDADILLTNKFNPKFLSGLDVSNLIIDVKSIIVTEIIETS
jgi:hypothetical protein